MGFWVVLKKTSKQAKHSEWFYLIKIESKKKKEL